MHHLNTDLTAIGQNFVKKMLKFHVIMPHPLMVYLVAM